MPWSCCAFDSECCQGGVASERARPIVAAEARLTGPTARPSGGLPPAVYWSGQRQDCAPEDSSSGGPSRDLPQRRVLKDPQASIQAVLRPDDQVTVEAHPH